MQEVLDDFSMNPNKLFYKFNDIFFLQDSRLINKIVNKYYEIIKEKYNKEQYSPFTKQQMTQILLFKKNKYINVKMLIICSGNEIINKIKIKNVDNVDSDDELII